jgi:hypothetical protein
MLFSMEKETKIINPEKVILHNTEDDQQLQ